MLATQPKTPPPLGFSTQMVSDHSQRTFSIQDAGSPIVIEVSEPMSMRQAMNGQVVGSLALPLTFLIVAVSAIAYAQVTIALRPARRMSAEIDAREADDFRPLGGHRIPEEIAPFFNAFNRPLARLGGAISREREFADNAAHELRTPLAVLKTRAQIVARDLGGDPERRDQVEQLLQATDRATGVIDQLLLLNRMNAGSVAPEPVDLSELVGHVCRNQAIVAIEKHQDFGADVAPGIVVPGHSDALTMLLRNLVDNAICYSPPKAQIDISLCRTAGGDVELCVTDTGPGIPQAQHASVFDRFRRLSHNEPGSGLGLAIVRRIIDQHGGSISLAANMPHGLCVRVILPSAHAD
jgi:signal transduction histidine kinase